MVEEKTQAPAVTRAAAVLDELAAVRGRPLGVSELARRLSLPKSSLANICVALTQAGLAGRSDGGFVLGRRLAELGAAYLASVDEVREFHDVVRDQACTLGETVQLATLESPLSVVYLARRDGTQPVRLASDAGRRLPASCTATGQAMLASLDEDELDARLDAAPLPAMTPSSVTNPRELREALRAVRARGYAVDDEETMEGVLCVGTHVGRALPEDGRLAISITVLKARATPERQRALAEKLRELAVELGRRLGAGGHVTP